MPPRGDLHPWLARVWESQRQQYGLKLIADDTVARKRLQYTSSLGELEEDGESFLWICMADSELKIDVRIPSTAVKAYNDESADPLGASGSRKDLFSVKSWRFVLAYPPEPFGTRNTANAVTPVVVGKPRVCLQVKEIAKFGNGDNVIIQAHQNKSLLSFRLDERVKQTLESIEDPDGKQGGRCDPEVVCEGDLPTFVSKASKVAAPAKIVDRSHLAFTRAPAPASRPSGSSSIASIPAFDWSSVAWLPRDIDYSIPSRTEHELAKHWNGKRVKRVQDWQKKGKKIDPLIEQKLHAECESLERETKEVSRRGRGKGESTEKECTKRRTDEVTTSSSAAKPRQLPTPTSIAPVAVQSKTTVTDQTTSNPIDRPRRDENRTRTSTSPSQRLSQPRSQSSSGSQKKKSDSVPLGAQGEEQAIDQDRMNIDCEPVKHDDLREKADREDEKDEKDEMDDVNENEMDDVNEDEMDDEHASEQVPCDDTPTPETLAQARATDQARASVQEEHFEPKGIRVTHEPTASELAMSDDEDVEDPGTNEVQRRKEKSEQAVEEDRSLTKAREEVTSLESRPHRLRPRRGLGDDFRFASRHRLKAKAPQQRIRYSLDDLENDDADFAMAFDDPGSEGEVEQTLLSQKQGSQNQAKKAAASSSPVGPTREAAVQRPSQSHSFIHHGSGFTSARQLLERADRQSRPSSTPMSVDVVNAVPRRAHLPLASLAPTQASTATPGPASHTSTMPAPTAAQAAVSATPFTASMINNALGGGDVGDSTMESISLSGIEAGFPRGGQQHATTTAAFERNGDDEANQKRTILERAKSISTQRNKETIEREFAKQLERLRDEAVVAAAGASRAEKRKRVAAADSNDRDMLKKRLGGTVGVSGSAQNGEDVFRGDDVRRSKDPQELARASPERESDRSSRSRTNEDSKKLATTTATTRESRAMKTEIGISLEPIDNSRQSVRPLQEEDQGVTAPSSSKSRKRSRPVGEEPPASTGSSLVQTRQIKTKGPDVVTPFATLSGAVKPPSPLPSASGTLPVVSRPLSREEEWRSLVASFASRRPSSSGETPIDKLRTLRDHRKRCESAVRASRV